MLIKRKNNKNVEVDQEEDSIYKKPSDESSDESSVKVNKNIENVEVDPE